MLMSTKNMQILTNTIVLVCIEERGFFFY